MHNQTSQMQLLLGALRTEVASQWLTRSSERGDSTWTGLWKTDYRRDVHQAIAQYAQPVNSPTAHYLRRTGRLPGVRDVTHLIGMVVEPGNDVDMNTLMDQPDQLESKGPLGIPIYDQGVLEQAHVTETQQATHMVRHLDDYHEPTLQGIRRQLLLRLTNPDDGEQRLAAGAQAITIFLKQPLRWRDVVEATMLKRTLKAIETEVGTRIRGPRRTNAELRDLVALGITMLFEGEMAPAAREIQRDLHVRQEHLASARWVLMYEEHSYLQLSGVIAGRSVRRHLPRGLHVIFSDQTYRRKHRIAGLWLDASDDEHTAAPYYYAHAIPPAYAAKQQPATFRLPDEDALWRYIEHNLS